MPKLGKIHIGTSGWHYSHWKGPFYPAKLREKEFLLYYLQFFQTVEINNSFYRLPDSKILKNYAKLAPKGSIFAIKMSRYVTHMKKLKDPKKPLKKFW